MHELPRAPDRAGEADAASLRAYLRVVASRRWTILSALLVIFTVVLVFTMKEKPLYEARALVEIQQEDPNIATVQNLFQIENTSDDYLEKQYKILQSDNSWGRSNQEITPGPVIRPESRGGNSRTARWTACMDATRRRRTRAKGAAAV